MNSQRQSDNVDVQMGGGVAPAVAMKAVDEDNSDYFNSFPPGYRFVPTDDELIDHYLQKKVLNQKLPMNRIRDVELYKHEPEHLADLYPLINGEKEWYFFTPRDRKYKNGNRPKRAAGNGYWKATGSDKPIHSNGQHVGFRKALVFYHGKPPKGKKSNWIMYEFRVIEGSTTRTIRGPNDMKLDDWVLCKIYRKLDKSLKKKVYNTKHQGKALKKKVYNTENRGKALKKKVHNTKHREKDIGMRIENGNCFDGYEDSGPAKTPNNFNLPEIPCSFNDEMENYMGLTNLLDVNQSNHQFNLTPLPSESYHLSNNDIAYQCNIISGYGDAVGLVGPISFNRPTHFIEGDYQPRSLATGHANGGYWGFNQENYNFNTSNFGSVDDLFPNTTGMPPFPRDQAK